MIEVEEYSIGHKSAWNEYVSRSQTATIAHRIEWRDIIGEALGHEPRYLIAIEDGNICGILPLFLVTTLWRARYMISIPWLDYGGICADNANAVEALYERASEMTRNEKAKFMEFRSVNADDIDSEHRLDKASFLLPLENDPEKLWKSFNAKLRNQIRKADKSGLTADVGGVEYLDEFYDVFSENMRDLGTPVWGKDLFSKILEQLPQNAELILVRMNELVIAGGLILSFKDRQYVPSASSLRRFIKYCPNNALYWTVIERACREGFRFFDFGRSSWDSGTFKFKKQWGVPPEQLVWQYYLNTIDEVPRINPTNPKYRKFIKLWRKMPLGLTKYLGPKLIKNFP